MTVRRLLVCAGILLAAVSATPQGIDRDAYARDHVQFQVLQLDQWSKEFPQQFYANLMRPPVEASKAPETARASAGELGEAVKRLAALSTAQDVMTNAAFRSQLDRALTTSKELNEVMSTQRFPAPLQNSWDQMRSILNNLARVYKLNALAVLDAPSAAGRGPAPVSKKSPAAGGLTGYIVDVSCAKRGKGMWANAECVARCVRDGDRVVLVTEEGKVYQIANQDKIAPESYGQVVTLAGKVEGESITVDAPADAPADPPAPEVWTFDRLDRIGGHATTVLGHPRVIDTPLGKAVEFNGTDDALVIGVHPLAGAATYTWEAIFRPDGGQAEQRWFHLEENPGDGIDSNNRMLFEIRVIGGRWCLDAFNKTGPNQKALLNREHLHDLGKWYHVAAVYDGRQLRSYIDGVEDGAGEVQLAPQAAGRASVGMRLNKVFHFKGAVRTARFTRRALTPAEFLKAPPKP